MGRRTGSCQHKTGGHFIDEVNAGDTAPFDILVGELVELHTSFPVPDTKIISLVSLRSGILT